MENSVSPKRQVKKGDIYEWFTDPNFVWKVTSDKSNENGYYDAVCMKASGRWDRGDEGGWAFDETIWIYKGNVND